MLGLYDGIESSTGIDYASPVEYAHPLNIGKVFWGLCLPGTMGGAKLRNLMSPADLIAGYNHGALTSMGDPNLQSGANGWRGLTHPGGMGSIKADGTAGFVDFGVIAGISGMAKCTYSTWVYRTATGMTNGWGRPSVLNARFSCLWFTDKKIYGVCDTGGGGAYNVTAAITLTGWHHVTIVYDGTLAASNRIAIYVDGIAQSGLTSFGTLPAFAPTDPVSWTWGKYQSAAFGAGSYDDMQVWVGTALPPVIIASLYDLSQRGYPGMIRRIGTTVYFLAPAVGAPGQISERFSVAGAGMSVSDGYRL